MPKLTKRTIDGLKPNLAGKDLFVWDEGDGAVKGFGVRLKPSGIGSYIVQYRNKEGRTRRMTVGRIGILTPEQARDEAKDKLREAAKGGDPSVDRQAARQSMTVAELCDWYLRDAKAWVKPSTLAVDKSRIEAHVKPLLGNRAVSGLILTDIEKFQADVASGKTARPRQKKGRSGHIKGGRGVAARSVGMFGTILEFAKRKGLMAANPARGVRKFQEDKLDRFLSYDEIKALGEAIRDAEGENENKTGIAAIKALLLTGCRRNEILALPWEWLDQKSKCIRFADTKGGAQIRPIGKAAVEHFNTIAPKKDCSWVFCADKGDGHFVGLPRVLARLCKRAGLKDVSLHVLRHTYAAVAAEMGFSELTIAGLLGHKVSGVTARYAHVPDSALVSAADRVSNRIMDVLNGEKCGEVVHLKSVKNF
ncbi:MAG: tyrosine-type recombinase/integrase [Micavibrio sp.]